MADGMSVDGVSLIDERLSSDYMGICEKNEGTTHLKDLSMHESKSK